MSINNLSRKDFLYASSYCEENIWHLCKDKQLKNSYVVFIASKTQFFPMLNQRAAKTPTTPIFWDYHVILLLLETPNKILDFDTTLAFSTSVKTYFETSFIRNDLLNDEYVPFFRLVSSKEFVDCFSSDRRHMKSEQDWLAPPPSWPLIGKNRVHNLHQFIDMNDKEIGEILSLEELLERYS